MEKPDEGPERLKYLA